MDSQLLSRTFLQFSADPRLAAAAGGVVRYFAEAAGMESDAIAKLQAATLAVCAALSVAHGNHVPDFSVEVNRFTDRIEIAVASPGQAGQQVENVSGVDRVERKSLSGSTITRLTKYVPQPAEAAS